MKRHVSHSLKETERIAADWVATLRPAQAVESETTPETAPDSALVIGLSGHLGAGKTAFTKAVASALGVHENVTSPTFVIMKRYPTKHPYLKHLVHIDAYRLERAQELEALDFERIVSDPGNMVFIEWPEHVKDALWDLANYREISFRIGDTDTERVIAEVEPR